MLKKDAVIEIVNLYRKHGWSLSKVIASTEDFEALSKMMHSLAPEIICNQGNVSSIWFSRRSRPDCVTWELRRLADPPFALIKVIPDTLSLHERDTELLEIEKRMSPAQ